MNKTVYFFNNGNTGVCIGEEQVPHLQKSWLRLFAEHLEANGQDPTTFEYKLPGFSKPAHVFRTPDGGLNWRFD